MYAPASTTATATTTAAARMEERRRVTPSRAELPGAVAVGVPMDAVRREIAGHLASALLLSSSGTATPGRVPTTATGEADDSDHPTMASLLRAIVYPHNRVHGDFAVPVAKLAKFDNFPAEQHPALVARKWAASIQPGTYVAKADAIGMYINIHVHPVAVTKMILTEIFEKRESFGTWKTLGHGKNVIVEFSSPNINKTFDTCNLRSTIVGNFIKNIHVAFGFNVLSMNWLGDWGTPFAGLTVGFKKYGSEEELSRNPVKHLTDTYLIPRETNWGEAMDDSAVFKQMEDGDAEALGLWKHLTDHLVVEPRQIYKRLNVTFDVWSGESEMCSPARLSLLEQRLREHNLTFEKQGAQVVDLNAQKLGEVVLRKRNGRTLYMIRDLASAVQRWETHSFDKMFYVTNSTCQTLHFRQMFKVLELMKCDWVSRCTHIPVEGVCSFRTRAGIVKPAMKFLDEIASEMRETINRSAGKQAELGYNNPPPEKIADILGVSAVILQYCSLRRRTSNDSSICDVMKGGPYIQYTHARLCGIQRTNADRVRVTNAVDFHLLSEPEASHVAVLLAKYPEVVRSCFEQLDPCPLVHHLFKLAHAVRVAFPVLMVKGQEQNIAEARMLLFWAARIVIGNGLALLGITPLHFM
ncbi:arginyl-tRNA synthetase [Pelomyxa schiedti]|nr:arginyl-tRNA synthetase [Pelomyxa schiedti]